jgi:UDP-MurNAc hydroxylase
MEFKVLSHACLLVRHQEASVVIDPWLVGSCYWRSWWNFPEPDFDESELRNVNAVFISHIHWDHWHGPSLKKFFHGKRIYIPDEPGMRSERDLRSIGFKDVVRIRHGGSVDINGIRVWMYQFGRFLNDSAVVLQAGGTTLLNANDAKLAGRSLSGLLSRHGPIDFAFRSHSSANPRVCFSLVDDNSYAQDDREHYFRAFNLFMNVVNPRYAVPFASNHCHLHDDVFSLNEYISNPIELRNYCEQIIDKKWQIKVMLPGSIWRSDIGFKLRSESEFLNLTQSLASYRQKNLSKLREWDLKENSIEISSNILERFIRMFAVRGKPRNCRGRFLLTLRWPNGRREGVVCDVDRQTFLREAETPCPAFGLPEFQIPALVFRDAVLKNMFHHAGISKRCQFRALNIKDLNRLNSIFSFLELYEHGVYPISWVYIYRFLKAYRLRWRELLVYFHALWMILVRRKPMYLVEEAILGGKL